MAVTATGLIKRAKYIIWSTKAVAAVNRDWAWNRRRPDHGHPDVLMTRNGLDSWLYRWGIETGRIAAPAPSPAQGQASFVAVVFARDPEAVKRESRNYWRKLLREQGCQ